MALKLLKDGTVITWDDANQRVKVLRQASVLINDDRIAAIEEDSSNIRIPANSDVEIIDVKGKIISPGFINTHTHSWQSVFRTVGPNVILSNYFTGYSQNAPNATEAFTPDDVYVSSLESYLEGINSGVTSYVEHATVNWSADVVEPGYDAAIDSGTRVWWCFDVAGRQGFSEEVQYAKLSEITKKKPSDKVYLGLALDSQAGSKEHIEEVKRKVKKLNFQAFTTHCLAGPWPGNATTPSSLCKQGLQHCGIPIIISHAPFLTEEDLRAIREHDIYTSITPESECHFGHGQATGHLITDHASIGTDLQWTFSGDIITQARLWLQIVRNTNYHATLNKGKLPNANPMTVEQAFLLATRQGGRALRRGDIGVIQVGSKADIVVFDGDSPNMLGWSDPVAAVILHANAADVEHVFVDGKFLKKDFNLIVNGRFQAWATLRTSFVEAAKRIQEAVKIPPSLPEKLWGIGEFGDVDIATTVPS